MTRPASTSNIASDPPRSTSAALVVVISVCPRSATEAASQARREGSSSEKTSSRSKIGVSPENVGEQVVLSELQGQGRGSLIAL